MHPATVARARVIADYGADYLVDKGSSTQRALARRCDPAVGDWVVLDAGFITEVLPRSTVFSRRAPGAPTREQVLAANIDIVFVVAVATEVNARRLERYLTIAWQSGAVPAVVVTKADLAETFDFELPGVEVVVTSSITGKGVDDVARMLQPSKTGILLGPSGAGKSTLINRLAGEELMKTREIHRSGEGRHVTSHRQMIRLPGGGMIIDTPGVREAQLWLGTDALGGAFDDIERLAAHCRFNDCGHRGEPGCAVMAAIADGSLEPARLESYRKLQRELLAVARKSDARLREDERRRWRRITLANRERERQKSGYLRR